MPCAEGTVCAPAGLTDDLRILDEDEDEGNGGLSSSPGLPSTHHGTHPAGGTLTGVHGGMALAAFFVWAIAA